MDAALPKLSERGIYFGTSSWKYPGWRGLVYRQAYKSEKDFQTNCLEEYTGYYPTVGIDHTYYAWPLEKTFAKYDEQTPAGFKFGLKATEKVTVFQYPKQKRYGKEAGKKNEEFLNPELFLEKFILPLKPLHKKIGVIMFEFSQFHPGTISSGSEFVERLGAFFKELRKETDLPFAVELRNAGWLKPAYFKMLVENHSGHVFNSWTKMPPLAEQLSLTEGYQFPIYPARLLLEPGVKYAEAVEAYSPYDKLHHTLTKAREAAAQLVLRALREKAPAYVYVNNRFEGCAPKTIEGILEKLEPKIGQHTAHLKRTGSDS